jgi:PEP-CTERM motif
MVCGSMRVRGLRHSRFTKEHRAFAVSRPTRLISSGEADHEITSSADHLEAVLTEVCCFPGSTQPPVLYSSATERTMKLNAHARALILAVAMIAAPTVTQAQYTVYTTLSSFLAAVGANGTETFNGLPFTRDTPAPIQRNPNGFSFEANVRGGFRAVGTPDNPALSQVTPGITWFINGFTSNTRAFGGNFWVTDAAGAFTSGCVSFGVVDIAGNRYDPDCHIPSSPGSFWGIVLTNPLSQVYLGAITFGNSQVHGTVDNLILAAGRTNVVPEPSTYALFGTGLVLMAGIARRRRVR